MAIALLNLNLVKVPATAPYAIDVLASALDAAGEEVDVVDLCPEDDPAGALHAYFGRHRPELVGLSMRNAVDMYLPSLFDLAQKGSFLDSHKQLVDLTKAYVDTDRLLIGGVGFSVNPKAFLKRLGLRYGIAGPGETVLCRLADELKRTSLRELAGGAETFVFGWQETSATAVSQAHLRGQPMVLRERWVGGDTHE